MRFLSSKVHTYIGLAVGLALLAAPWLFGFAEAGGAAVAVPLAIGAFILLSELTTTSPVSPFKLVSMSAHIVMDVLTGLFLALSPWLFGFNDLDANAWLPHLIVGIAVVAYAMLTQPENDSDAKLA